MLIQVNPEVEKGFRVLPPGIYNGMVVEADFVESDKSAYVKVQMQVQDPQDFAGVAVFDNLMARQDLQGNLRCLVEAITGVWQDFDTEVLKGQMVQFTTFQEEYQGEKQHRVRRFSYKPAGPIPTS